MKKFDQLSFCDWRKSPTPNQHRNIALILKGVVSAFRLDGSMFDGGISAEYKMLETP